MILTLWINLTISLDNPDYGPGDSVSTDSISLDNSY